MPTARKRAEWELRVTVVVAPPERIELSTIASSISEGSTIQTAFFRYVERSAVFFSVTSRTEHADHRKRTLPLRGAHFAIFACTTVLRTPGRVRRRLSAGHCLGPRPCEI